MEAALTGLAIAVLAMLAGLIPYLGAAAKAALDLDAAIRATSWGEFQVLGDNLGLMDVPGMTPRA